MEFLSAYNFNLSYRRGKDNVNADSFSRLPLPPTEEDISGACALSDPRDLGVYFIRACGFILSFCPIPGIGLGGLASSSPTTPSSDLAGLIPQSDPPILGGLTLNHADFRTHRAPLPQPHMAGSVDRTHVVSAGNPHSLNTFRSLENDTRLLITRRSGFAASAASAPPPRPSRLDSTA